MSAYRFLWWSIAVPIGSVGVTAAVVSSSIPTTVIIFGIVALCLGVLSANLQSLNCEGQPRGPISASTVCQHGCAAALAVVSFYGLSSLVGVAVLPLAILLAVTCPTVVTRWRIPAGFGIWLASGARAPGNPARYLPGRPDGKHRQP
jgi:hypothetical protein